MADHRDVAATLNALAGLYRKQGRYADAEKFHDRALAIREKALGPDHPDVAETLSDLALVFATQGRFGEAEPPNRRALAIRQRALGADHPLVATSLNNLALLYYRQGRYAEAEPLYARALAISRKTFGPDHADVAVTLDNLAGLYFAQGRYGEAERRRKRALAIRETSLGPDHPDVARTLSNLALLYQTQGRYGEVEPLFDRALAIREAALAPDHPDVGETLNNLALHYAAQGRYGAAERRYKRALVIREQALGPGHPRVGILLSNLASLLTRQARHDEAEQLHERALAIREAAHGPDHPNVAVSLNNLAALYNQADRYGEAEPLLRRALTIWQRAFGADHPDVATALNNLALLHAAEGRPDVAEPQFKRALAIRERTLGPDHPRVATSLNNLAATYDDQGRFGEALPLHQRALAIREAALGPDHTDVAVSLDNLAVAYRAQGRLEPALAHVRRASAIHRARSARTGGAYSRGATSEQRAVRHVFLRHLLMTLKATDPAARDAPASDALVGEGFEAGQLANATGVGAAVARMAARFAAGDDTLANVIRRRQDAAARWRQLDAALVRAASQPPDARDTAGEAAMRRELAVLDERISGFDATLATHFPRFAELSSPQPVPLAEAQALLAADEALLTYLVWDDVGFVFALRHDRALVRQIDIGAAELEDAVAALRRGLDPSDVRSLDELPPFDTTGAFELYERLFAPAEPLLAGARHIFVVPDGALQSLPLGVLVTRESSGAFTDFTGYRHAAWLARKYAMTTLPAVSSLRALRTFARRARASQPFLGVGDPQLRGATGSGRGVAMASLFTARGIADVASVRRLASLPDTADELRTAHVGAHARRRRRRADPRLRCDRDAP